MRLIRASVAAALAFTLVACGGDDEPPAPPETVPSSSSTSSSTTSTSEAPSETAEPTPTPPPLPPEAQTPDAVGAGAFVRHWFDLANYAYATGNTAPLQTIAVPDCQSCSALIASIDRTYETGGNYEGGVVKVLGAESAPPDDQGVALVTTVIEQEAVSALDADGTVVAEEPAVAPTPLSFFAEYQAGSWRTFAIAPVES